MGQNAGHSYGFEDAAHFQSRGYHHAGANGNLNLLIIDLKSIIWWLFDILFVMFLKLHESLLIATVSFLEMRIAYLSTC